ncbi:hypothetical protein GKE82_16900 [Conexibacter sp. W3-3-2]|uniref:hypothetical protein n=1 Tax=Conexibacter sp. W3-3-2 TaxID=2675227 RepID=UPI0012B78252|nr:hypothetical protein [Conexibacter sp. W3-3-2]MTD45919.1 hypothetical protein [Conexibacter sp. W3-3-2]
MCAEYLYIASENLARVVAQRLRSEAGLEDAEDWKHRLAVASGIHPRSTGDRSHLGKFDTLVRTQHIFDGDHECYRLLRDASDGFEHGHVGFDKVRAGANAAAETAFGLIRRAILRELALPRDCALFDKRFDHPLGGWKPVLELDGTYTETAPPPGPGFTPEATSHAWPDFYGPHLIPRISDVTDLDGTTRQVELTIDGSGNSLNERQHVVLRETPLALPQRFDGGSHRRDPDGPRHAQRRGHHPAGCRRTRAAPAH